MAMIAADSIHTMVGIRSRVVEEFPLPSFILHPPGPEYLSQRRPVDNKKYQNVLINIINQIFPVKYFLSSIWADAEITNGFKEEWGELGGYLQGKGDEKGRTDPDFTFDENVPAMGFDDVIGNT